MAPVPAVVNELITFKVAAFHLAPPRAARNIPYLRGGQVVTLLMVGGRKEVGTRVGWVGGKLAGVWRRRGGEGGRGGGGGGGGGSGKGW